jgi:hypothetical protein
MPVAVGTERVKLGQIAAEQVPLQQLAFDYSVPLEKSPFLRWKRRFRREIVENFYHDLKVGAGEAQTDAGLDSMERLAGAGLFGWSGRRGQQQDFITVEQWWLDPGLYRGRTFKETVLTVSGIRMEAGRSYDEYFPDGMCVLFVPGTKVLLHAYNNHHSQHWVSAPFHLKLMSGVGNSIGEAVETQRQFNLVLALVFKILQTAAGGSVVYNRNFIDPTDAKQLLSQGKAIPANLYGENVRLSDAYQQVQPGQPPQAAVWYIGQLDRLMAQQTGALEASDEALPGFSGRTATGAKIGASVAASQYDPVLALKADADERGAKLLLKLAQKHYHDARWIPRAFGRRGSAEGGYYSSADLDGEIRVKAKPGSWRSRTDWEKREAFAEATNLLASWGGPEAPKEVVRQIEELTGVDFGFDQYSAQARLCRLRLGQIKKLAPLARQTFEALKAEMATAQVDAAAVGDAATAAGLGVIGQGDLLLEAGRAMALAVKPSMSVEELKNEPGLMECVTWCQEWFIDDEGIEADEYERAGVRAMIQLFKEALIAQGQEEQMAALAADPMAQASLAMQAEAHAAKTYPRPVANRAKPEGGAPPARPKSPAAGAGKFGGKQGREVYAPSA